jgi:hypothetical protein
MASLSIIKNNGNLNDYRRNLYFLGQSHIDKFYSTTLFKCVKEGHDSHCAINM